MTRFFFILVFVASSLVFSTNIVFAIDSVDINHYVQKFGFYQPTQSFTISKSELDRLKIMYPYVISATNAYNTRYHQDVEPELIVWWSYAETGGGYINYSNCNGNSSFTYIANCSTPQSGGWQLGYGIQFEPVKNLLKNAFTDLHGNPDNATLVQKTGQTIIDYDRSQHTTPACGGYSCTFPSMTIDQIVSGVSTSHLTSNNWWASLLAREPAIDSYINASALQVTSFNRQLAWGWGSYYKTNWQLYSNYLCTILRYWQDIGGSSSGCGALAPTTTPTPTPTLSPTPVCPSGTCQTAIGPIKTNSSDFLKTLFTVILSLSGGIAILLTVWGGYRLALSQGNPEKVQQARESITSAVIGLLFIIFSVAILQIIGIDVLALKTVFFK